MTVKIKIYSTPSCVYCQMAKEFFKKNGFEYEEVDVSKDQAELEAMVKKSHQMGVPVIEINDKVFVGFNRSEIEKELKVVNQ